MFYEDPNTGGLYPLKLGIDRPSIDFNASISNFLNKDLLKRNFKQCSYPNHPIFLRRARPLFCYNQMNNRHDGVLSHLSFSCQNKSKGMISSLKWFSDGKRLLTGTQLSELAIWNGVYFNFEDMKRVPVRGGAVTCLEWSRNDNLFAGNSLGEIVILSSALNLLDNCAFEGLNKSVMDISLSCCNSKLAGCSDTCNPIIWDVKTRKIIKHLKGKNIDTNNTNCLSWNPINEIIASGNRTQIISFWDIRSNKPIISINAHKANVNKIRWNYNGVNLLSCSKDSTIKLWDIRNFKLVHYYRNDLVSNTKSTFDIMNKTNPTIHNNYEPTFIAFNPIQHHIFAAADNRGSITFYSTNDNRIIRTVHSAHSHTKSHGYENKNCSVTLLDWNPLGHLLVSFGEDKLLKFWSASNSDRVVSKSVDAKTLIQINKNGAFPNSKFIREEYELEDISSDLSIYDSDEQQYEKNKLNHNYYVKYKNRKKRIKRNAINRKLKSAKHVSTFDQQKEIYNNNEQVAMYDLKEQKNIYEIGEDT